MLNTSKTSCMFVGCRGLTSQIAPDTCLRVDGTPIVPSNFVSKTKTQSGTRSILVDGPKYWKSLPHNVRCAQSMRCFKKSLLLYLCNEQFKSIGQS